MEENPETTPLMDRRWMYPLILIVVVLLVKFFFG
jgi:Mg2+ and Co2+ transporter CorA